MLGPGSAEQRCTLHRVRGTRTYIRSAVHVPVHMLPRQVPEPEVPLSRPEADGAPDAGAQGDIDAAGIRDAA